MLPSYDPLAAVLGCGLVLLYGALVIAGFTGVVLAIRSRRRPNPTTAGIARWTGSLCFLGGMTVVIAYSHLSYRSPEPLLLAGAALAILGTIPWMLAMHAASLRERRVATAVAGICILAALTIVRHDSDYRRRRDALFTAAKRGDVSVVRRLLATGLDANLTDDVHRPLLLMASNAPTAEAVFAAGANPRLASAALPDAADRGNVALANVLLAHGADPNAKQGDYSAARLAWWNGHQAMLEVLRRAGARDAETFQRATGALLAATRAGDAQRVRQAVAGEFLDTERRAALAEAAARGELSIIAPLVAHTDAYTEIADAALIAARNKHAEAFDRLMDELVRRRAGFIIQETRAAAQAIGKEPGSRSPRE